MGCLFSKRAGPSEEDLIQSASGASDDPPVSLAAREPTSVSIANAETSPAAVESSTPDILKPMGRGGFAEITTGIQAQLGSWKAPLNPSETGEEGQRYITNENFHEVQLGATLGKGNYGVVHAGTWRGDKIAVKKVLLPEGMGQGQQRRLVEDFKCEVDICCRLKHPRLVDFLGYTTAPSLCIVQELMEQGSLYDQFRKGWRAKSLEQQVVLAHDIARGMAYLHAWQPPLIHRDLKSLNILVSVDSRSGADNHGGASLARCKVTDFGMTRAKAMGRPTEAEARASGASPADVMTLAMTRCGTPFWTAPEIIRGGTYNETVDQYAYGCVCLEILTGSPPWTTGGQGGGSKQMAPMKVMQMVVRGERPALPPDANPQFASILQKCWAQDPSSRPRFKQVVSSLKQVAKEAGFTLARD